MYGSALFCRRVSYTTDQCAQGQRLKEPDEAGVAGVLQSDAVGC